MTTENRTPRQIADEATRKAQNAEENCTPLPLGEVLALSVEFMQATTAALEAAGVLRAEAA